MRTTLFLLFAFCNFFAAAQAPYVFKEFDLEPGSGSSSPRYFKAVNNKLFFTATTVANGSELWICDGTTAGTKMLKDIYPGTQNGAGFYYLKGLGADLGNKLIFPGENATNGNELWVSDGTTAGTIMLKDIYTGTGDSDPLYSGWAPIGGKIVFGATSVAEGTELWITDGTPAGTTLLKDIEPGSTGSGPSEFIPYKGKVYFIAQDAVNGVRLWYTDGTASGTQMTNVDCDGMGSFMLYNGLLLVWRFDATYGYELWKTDGTAAGTSMIKDINPGFSNGKPAFFTFSNMQMVYNNKFYFVANNNISGEELWVTDGTNIGTQMVKEIRPGTGPTEIGDMYIFNNKLYFSGKDATADRFLWETDGTSAGTKIANNNYLRSAPAGAIIEYKKSLFYVGYDKSVTPFPSHDIYKSNGTVAGTTKIGPTNLTEFTFNTAEFIIVDSTLYFCAGDNSSKGYELWSMKDTTGIGSINVPHIENERTIALYPNPVHDKITIKITTAYKEGSVSLYDMAGRLVIPSMPISGSLPIVSVKDMAKGIYTISIMLDGKEHKQKLAIE